MRIILNYTEGSEILELERMEYNGEFIFFEETNGNEFFLPPRRDRKHKNIINALTSRGRLRRNEERLKPFPVGVSPDGNAGSKKRIF